MDKLFQTGQTPLVSVVIPVYNAEAYLRECLESLRNQTYFNWECILVDDGSTDGSNIICDEYRTNDSRFVVVHQDNKGVSTARNTGIECVSGKFCMFIDSDDLIDLRFLETAVALMEKYNPDIVQFAYTRNINQLGTRKDDKDKAFYSDRQIRDDILKFNLIFPTVWGKLYRSDLIHGLKFNVECSVLEDVEFLTRVMCNTTVFNDTLIAYYYRKTPGSLITQGLTWKELIGSIASHNACIENLKEEDSELFGRAITFKYTSLFNWLIRTAKFNNWKDFYLRIREETIKDRFLIISSKHISYRVKAILLANAVSPTIAHMIISTVLFL